MNTLTLKIKPSKDTDDHQVRIVVDGVDYLDNYLGIDPPQFFDQKKLFKKGKLLIGRCDCGFEGCHDIFVDVEINGNKIIWNVDDSTKFEFNKIEYMKYISEKKNDNSWEDLYRRVERLVSIELKNTKIYSDYIFEWASCRIDKNKIVLSYCQRALLKPIKQEILEIRWNGIDCQDAIKQVKEFIKEYQVKVSGGER